MIGPCVLDRYERENYGVNPDAREARSVSEKKPPASKVPSSSFHVDIHQYLSGNEKKAARLYLPFAPFAAHGFFAAQGLAAQGFFTDCFPLAAQGLAAHGFAEPFFALGEHGFTAAQGLAIAAEPA
jgi:hypothetical protein